MPWISFDTKGKHFPWRKVSWKKYAELMKRYFNVKVRKHKPVPPAPKPVPVPPPPKPKPKPVPVSRDITMYDSVTVSEIPPNAKAVAGYVGGAWPTFKVLEKQFPRARKLSIAVGASENADCLDVETDDATPDEAAAWVRRQKKRGIERPVVYTSAAFAQALVNKLDASGLRIGKDYKTWIAHYTFKPHRCGPKCGFGIKFRADATQWTDKALGRNLDASRVSPDFFPIK